MSRFSLTQLPETWKAIPIGQIVDIAYGKGLSKNERVETGNVPVYSSGGMIGYHDSALHTEPSIIIGRKGTVGSIFYTDKPFWCIDTAFYLKNFHPTVELEFLAYMLKVVDLSRFAIVVGVPGINRGDIEKQKIPLPTLPEQREIIQILRQADRLRQLRLEADKQTEMLALATFNAIFGFIDKNVSYRKVKLEKIADIESGVTKGRNLPSHETVTVPYLRVANVQDGYLDLTEIKTIDVLPADVDKYALQPGDVLLTEGGDFDKLGRGAMWEHGIPNCIHQNHVFRVRVDQNTLLPLFFNYYLQTAYARHYFLRSAKRTTNLASINKTQLGTLPVPIPPMPMQEKFVNAVNQIRSILATQENTRADIDQLTRAAMVYAFTGALTQEFREQNQAELIKLAAERDNALKETAQIDKPQMVETAEEFTRALVRNALSRSQQDLLALIESQDAYISTDISEIQGDLLPNEVIRDLELLKQLGLIKAVSIQFTPGRLGHIFFTKTYRPLQPGDNTKETDLVVLREAQEE